MDEKLVFSILGIEPTKDENLLKERYHELLTGCNPEDDPEGFKRLREAYETAVRFARQPETEEEEKKEKDEIDLWLDRVNDCYWYLATRNDPKAWKELFKDEVCMALDTALETRERFLVFLMSHVYVEQKIWQMFDAEFRIREDLEDLKEMFPSDFLSYIVYQIENKEFLAYDLLEVLALDEAEVEVDSYIVKYLRIKTDLDRGEQMDTIAQRIDDLRACEVYHPYEDVERIRLALYSEDPNKMKDMLPLVQKLLETDPEDSYIGYWCGRLYSRIGEWENAYTCWNTILQKNPEQYNARVGMAEYYIETEEYVKSKDLIMDLLEENGRDNYTLELMRKVNPYLIEYYKAEAEKEDYKKNMIEACWCMFQNEFFEDTLDLLGTLDIQKEDKEYYDYVNMTGRCYLGLEQYGEAIEYLKLWEEARQQLVDDGSDKYQKRISREGFIKSAIGIAYQSLKNYDMAELFLKEGIEKEKDELVKHSVMERLALLYYDRKNYTECKHVCDRIIEEDPEYYPAYLRRQQAAYENRDAQAVIDDYYNAVHLYAGYYRPYLLAVKVFVGYHQYEDARKVIEAARERQVEHPMLDLYEIKVLRNFAESDEEYEKALQLCARLKIKIYERKESERAEHSEAEMSDEEILDKDLKKDGMSDDEVLSDDVAFEQTLLYMDMERYEDALDQIKAVISHGNQEIRFRWIRADIYRIRRMYREAVEEYKELLKELPNEVDIIYYCGICLQRLDRNEEALRYYKQVQDLDPEHTRVHHALMEIYSSRYDKYELKSAYQMAIEEATKQLEIADNAYYYIERGLLYMDNFNFEEALADYRKALESEPENIYALNNIGYVYQAQGKFEEALEYYKKSISLMDEEWSILPFVNSSKCYQALMDWDQAIAVLHDALRHYKPSTSIYNRLIELYTCKKDIQKVKETCDRAEKMKLLSKADYYDKLSEAYFALGNISEGLHIFKEWYVWVSSLKGKGRTDQAQRAIMSGRRVYFRTKEGSREYQVQKARLVEAQGIFYFYHREMRKAVKYLEEAWRISTQYDLERTRIGIRLSNAYYMRGQKKMAETVANETMKYMLQSNHAPQKLRADEQEEPDTLEYYLSYRPLAPLRTFETAELLISLGDLDKAMQMLETCLTLPRCRHCAFGICYDAWLIMANIEEMRGNLKRAVELYEKAMKVNPHDIEPMLTLDALRSEKKGDYL